MSKTIGAMELSDMAFELEKAAEEENKEKIIKGYPVFESKYLKLAENIKAIL